MSTGTEGMVLYDVLRLGGQPVMQVGTITESGAIVLITAAPHTVINDPATVTALEQALEQAVTDQARIHRQLYTPREVTDELLAAAVRAYSEWQKAHQHRALGGERDCLRAALAAAGLNQPHVLNAAQVAYRHGYHGPEGSMRYALQAVLDKVWKR